jgi:recombination associated protein RdgC
MPLRRGSVNFAQFVFESSPPKDLKRWVLTALKKGAFEPIDLKSDEERAAGFVELEFSERTDFSVGSVFYSEAALFSFRVDTLKVASAKIRRLLLEWKQTFENSNGRAAGRAETQTQKDQIKKMLRAQTPINTKTFDVSLHFGEKRVLIWATSRTIVEDLQVRLGQGLGVELRPRVPAAFLKSAELDALLPTPELFEVMP